jgi:hypothetical protein
VIVLLGHCEVGRSSHYRRGMRFDEPELMIDAARYLGEEIGRISVADRRRLSDRFRADCPNAASAAARLIAEAPER